MSIPPIPTPSTPQTPSTPSAPTTHPATPPPHDDRSAEHEPASGTTSTTTPPPSLNKTDGTSAAGITEPTPPAWDPLGAARFAWDLPEPAVTTPPPAPNRERRSPFTLIVLGLAVIVGALGVAGNQAGIDWFTPAHVLALSLTVVGLGLVAAAFRRRRSGRHSTGLVPVAIALGVAVVVATAAADDFAGLLPAGGAGERVWTPLTENDIDAEYSLGMGTMTLDLREVTLTADRTVSLQNGLGEITVQIPEGMNVRAECSAGIGDYSCPQGLDGGSDGTDGPVLTIDAHTSMGSVEVNR